MMDSCPLAFSFIIYKFSRIAELVLLLFRERVAQPKRLLHHPDLVLFRERKIRLESLTNPSFPPQLPSSLPATWTLLQRTNRKLNCQHYIEHTDIDIDSSVVLHLGLHQKSASTVRNETNSFTIFPFKINSICHQNHRLKDGTTTDQESAKEDNISQLPDEVLISIMTHLSSRDAMRISTLSKRWRKLYVSLPDIGFFCADGFGSDCIHIRPGLKSQFFDSVDQYLLHFSGPKIRQFNLSCCFGANFPDRIKKCLYSLGRWDVEQLTLLFTCNYRRSCQREEDKFDFSFDQFLSGITSLKFLKLCWCVLQPSNLFHTSQHCCRKYMSSLKILHLSSVTCLPGAVECILSNCPNVESLEILYSKMTAEKLCISGTNLQLKFLWLHDNKGLKKIEFCACNLTTFGFDTLERMTEFSFDYVPQLENLRLTLLGKNIMPYICGKLSQDLPHLKSFTFDTCAMYYQEIYDLPKSNWFSDLRRLHFDFGYTFEANLLSLAPFLHGCPLLQEFHLSIRGASFNGREKMPSIVTILHTQLKKVDINGFSGTQNEIDFILYILRSASTLERMYISVCPIYCRILRKWEEFDPVPWCGDQRPEMIEQQFKSQVISNTAKVILRTS